MELKKSITVNQSIERVWKIMANDYTRVAEWTSQLTASKPNEDIKTKLEGAPSGGRVCTAPGFGDVKETITHFDEGKKYFRYEAEISSMPFFVKGISNAWSFRSLGPKQTEVLMHMNLQLNTFPGTIMAPMMRAKMSKNSNIILEELKHFAEQGHPHPRKIKALQKARVSTA